MNRTSSYYVTTIYLPKGDALNFALAPIRKAVSVMNCLLYTSDAADE